VECPTCRYPVPAEWSLCRRCGAPVHSEPEDARVTIPPSMHRPKATVPPAPRTGSKPLPTTPAMTPLAAIKAAARNGPPREPHPTAPPRADHLVPGRGSRRTELATRLGTLAGRNWRRILVLVVVAIALTSSIVAVWPVLFRSNSSPKISKSSAQEAVATDLLRTVVGGGRGLFATRHSFANMLPSTLSARSFHIPVVASTKVAPTGAVSMRIDGPSRMTLATPADFERCVFRARRTNHRRHALRHGAHERLPRRCRTRARLDIAMTVCPSCGGDVRPVWTKCRSCGALLIAPPAPVVPVGAAVTSSAPSAEEQFFAPGRVPVARPSRRAHPVRIRPQPEARQIGRGPDRGRGQMDRPDRHGRVRRGGHRGGDVRHPSQRRGPAHDPRCCSRPVPRPRVYPRVSR